MGITNLYQRKPPGASCNWIKEQFAAGAPYTWWRGTGTSCAFSKMLLGLEWTPNYARGVSCWGKISLEGFTLGGASSAGIYFNDTGAHSTCGTLGTYVTDATGGGVYSLMYIDFWRALTDGAWASSISVTARMSVRPDNGAPIAKMSLSKAKGPVLYGADVATSTGGGSTCTHGTSTVDTTFTVYDDGRVTIT